MSPLRRTRTFGLLAVPLAAATLITMAPGMAPGAVTIRTASAPASAYGVIASIAVGDNPFGVAVSNDDTVYVTNFGPDTMSVINPGTLVEARAVPVGSNPIGVAVSNDDTVYVTNQGSNSLSVMTGRNLDDSLLLTASLSNPTAVAVTQDDTVFVAQNNGSIAVYDATATRVASTNVSGCNNTEGIAVDQNDDTAFAASTGNSNVCAFPGRPGYVGIGPLAVGSGPWGIAVDSNDDSVYVANRNSNTLSIVNGRTFTVARTVAVGVQPWGVAVSSDDTVLVANRTSRTLSVINGRNLDDSVAVGVGIDPIAVAISSAGIIYVANNGEPTTSVVARLTPSLQTTTARAGAAATVSLTVPGGLVADDSTVQAVYFGDDTASGLTRSAGVNTWSVTVPSGSGSVPVTVRFNGGLTASAGTFTFVTAPPPVYPPGAPTVVVATAGDASAAITWVAPTDSGSFGVTDYQVVSSPGGRACLATAPALSCRVVGLTNGTSYTFTARALNGAGWGTFSTPSNAVTPRPTATPSIVIAGSRDLTDSRVVQVTGTTTSLAGSQVTPWLKFPGESSFAEGAGRRTVSSDETFTWQRRTGKKVSLYFAHEGVKSNTITIAAR